VPAMEPLTPVDEAFAEIALIDDGALGPLLEAMLGPADRAGFEDRSVSHERPHRAATSGSYGWVRVRRSACWKPGSRD